jgi:dephospho-CoA kinase
MSICSIAVTGGIACGKSTSGAALESLGVPVLDADAVGHGLLANDPSVKAELRERFGPAVFDGDRVDRKALGRVVFADESARRALEAILHPRIQARVREWLATTGACRLAVVQVPLLFEVGWEGDFDRIVCVACSPSVQRERLRGRGLADAEIDQRLSAQLPVEEKMKRSNVVIWSDGPKEQLVEQWRRVLENLTAGRVG